MNTNLLSIVKHITAQYGEDILEDARRLRALFSDLAKDEPKPLRMAFGKCVESGFYRIIKDTRTAEERRQVIDTLARRLRDAEGLDTALCTEALELLATSLFGEGQIAPAVQAAAQQLPAAPEPPQKPEAVLTPEYYLSFNFHESGPFDLSTMERMIANGQITRVYYCRTSPAQEWTPAASFPEFAALFPAESSPSPSPSPATPAVPATPATPPSAAQNATAPAARPAVQSQTPPAKKKHTLRNVLIAAGVWVVIVMVIVMVINTNDGQSSENNSGSSTASSDSNTAETHYLRGGEYSSNDDFNNAMKEYTEAIRLSPNNGSYLNSRAWTYYLLGNYAAGLEDANKALSLESGQAYIYETRGALYRALREYDKSLADYNEALRLDPNYAYAYMGRALTHWWKDQTDENWEAFTADRDKAVSINQAQSARVYSDIGIGWYHLGQYADALRFFNNALEINPGDEKALRWKTKAEAVNN